jgi:hypothetical protein
MTVIDPKFRDKLLRKLDKEMMHPKVELFDHGTGKRASIKKAFQVLGKLFSIELTFYYKVENEGGQLFVRHEYFLKKYNSRSAEGGYTYHSLEDIANAFELTVPDMEKYFLLLDELAKFKEHELEKAKAYMFKKIERSSKKLTTA